MHPVLHGAGITALYIIIAVGLVTGVVLTVLGATMIFLNYRMRVG